MRTAGVREARQNLSALLNTSALLKLYLPQPGSDEFNAAVEGRDDVLVSDLTVIELLSALARRLHQGSLARNTVRRLQPAIIGRLAVGVYHRVELNRDVRRRGPRGRPRHLPRLRRQPRLPRKLKEEDWLPRASSLPSEHHLLSRRSGIDQTRVRAPADSHSPGPHSSITPAWTPTAQQRP